MNLLLIHTVKALLIARAFIRIITFHKEVGGHLLEAGILPLIVNKIAILASKSGGMGIY